MVTDDLPTDRLVSLNESEVRRFVVNVVTFMFLKFACIHDHHPKCPVDVSRIWWHFGKLLITDYKCAAAPLQHHLPQRYLDLVVSPAGTPFLPELLLSQSLSREPRPSTIYYRS